MACNQARPREADDTRVLVDGAANGGRLALIEMVATPGSEPPRHLHHEEDEIVYVLAGALVVQRGAELLRLEAGEAVVLARGVEHAWRVMSAEARLLIVIAPAGLEAGWAELVSPGTPLERLVAIAARRGIEITGPPLGR